MLMIRVLAVFFCHIFTRYSQRPPALQSVWFIPHVATYMVAYTVLGCAFVLAILEFCKIKNAITCDLLIKIGTTALGIGMCLGALWAKKAWGQYWAWDIKETAALITWSIFLLFLHLKKHKKIKRKILLIIIIIGFLSLLFTWHGVNYLPVSQKSPHTLYKKNA